MEYIPGKIDARVLDRTHVQARVTEHGGHVDGPFNLELVVEESEPLDGARLVTKGNGASSTLTVTGSFSLMGDGPTWITWNADAEVEGDIANLGYGPLKGLADKKAGEIFGQISRTVETSE